MKRTKKNEELQSRREFFKKAAKGALPILGAIVLSGIPTISGAMEASSMGCERYSCSGGCSGRCTGTCSGTCSGSCEGRCSGGCSGGCKGTCYTSCADTCHRSNK